MTLWLPPRGDRRQVCYRGGSRCSMELMTDDDKVMVLRIWFRWTFPCSTFVVGAYTERV